jgi:hypothetical protein
MTPVDFEAIFAGQRFSPEQARAYLYKSASIRPMQCSTLEVGPIRPEMRATFTDSLKSKQPTKKKPLLWASPELWV